MFCSIVIERNFVVKALAAVPLCHTCHDCFSCLSFCQHICSWYTGKYRAFCFFSWWSCLVVFFLIWETLDYYSILLLLLLVIFKLLLDVCNYCTYCFPFLFCCFGVDTKELQAIVVCHVFTCFSLQNSKNETHKILS